jgi:hypothetical protein
MQYGGQAWPDAKPVDGSPDEFYPSISDTGADVHVVWTDERAGDRRTYHNRSADYGKTFVADNSQPLAISGATMDPSVAAVDQYVHVVWQQHQPGDPGCWDVYYQRSTDNGKTWLNPEKAVQLTTSADKHDGATWASVAAAAGVVHVAWTDDRDDASRVYYARNPKNGE